MLLKYFSESYSQLSAKTFGAQIILFKRMCSLGFESLPIKSNPLTSRVLDYQATQTETSISYI